MDSEAVDRARSWLQAQSEAASAVAQTIKDTALEKLHNSEVATPQDKGNKGERDDIDKSDLMQLCMKMNKKIKSLEAKLKESDSISASLLSERSEIVGAIKAHIPISIPVPPSTLRASSSSTGDDTFSRMDIKKLQDGVGTWIQMQENEKRELLSRVSTIDGDGDDGVQSGVDSNRTRALASKEAESKSLRDNVSYLENILADQEASFVSERTRMSESNDSLQETVKKLEGDLARFEKMKTDMEALSEKNARMMVELEEKELAEVNQKEMLHFLQNRLNEIDSEHANLLEEKKGFSSQLSSHQVLKAEQEALLSSLRESLQQALENNSQLEAEVVLLRVFKEKNTDKTEAFNSLSEESDELRDKIAELQALNTRLRQEAEKSSQNHAMRTAILASTEGELEQAREEIKSKEEEFAKALKHAESLAAEVKQREDDFNKTKANLEAEIAGNGKDQEQLRRECEERVRKIQEERGLELELAQKEFSKKSGMARQLLQEKEEDIRLLNEKIEVLSAEIRSGAPSERKIFEIAQSQAKREHLHSVKLDTREVAFQQLQEKLSLKDLQLAQLQTANSNLRAETAQLSRVAKREGVNMDYLKDVMLKFITFPVQSPEKASLVPVIAMLLQFSPDEVKSATAAVTNPVWSRADAIEVNIEALRLRSSD